MTVTVSVLCSVRNGGDVLESAISSVLQQSHKDITLLIVNDASVDKTTDVLDRYAARDSRVKILTNSVSKGLTRSLNMALALVDTPWVARIDHDDLWHTKKLEKQLLYLKSHPHIGLLGTAYQELHSDVSGQLIDAILPLCQTDEEIRKALYQFNPFFHSSIMVKRELIQKVGGYNEQFVYAQDYELWVRLLSLTKAAILPEILCYRRVGAENISIRKERSQRRNALRSKLLWTKLNGYQKILLPAVVRDLAVIVTPKMIKSVIRKKLHSRTG